jgi:hypothetical protein
MTKYWHIVLDSAANLAAKTWLLLCTLLTYMIWPCNFFLASKNEGIVPEIQQQMLTAPQAFPEKSIPEMLPVVTEMLDTMHTSEDEKQ